jgi:hypothetical protein
MRSLLYYLFIALVLTSYKQGEPIATLNGKSSSGRTIFTAELPSCSYLEKAELSVDGSKLKFSVSDGCKIIFDPESQVFTVYLESTDEKNGRKFLQFWALPSTFKKTKSERGPGSQFHDTYEFHAKVYATEPRKVKESTTKIIELVCTMDYEL